MTHKYSVGQQLWTFASDRIERCDIIGQVVNESPIPSYIVSDRFNNIALETELAESLEELKIKYREFILREQVYRLEAFDEKIKNMKSMH